MSLAESKLREFGFGSVKDTSANASHDFEAEKNGVAWIAEVKGTTGTGEVVIVTYNEVEDQRRSYPNNLLIVAHSIDLDRAGKTPVARGGELRVFSGWQVDPSMLRALTYSLDLRSKPGAN